MHCFLFEYVTGGGLVAQPLPKTLVNEAELIVNTLLTELAAAGHTDISLCRDQRCGRISTIAKQYIIDEQQSLNTILPVLLKDVDSIWLIAPETEQALLGMARSMIATGKLFIGCNLQAMAIATSKCLMNKTLSAAGINTVASYRPGESIPTASGAWIIKPDDGAGSCDCYLVDNRPALEQLSDKYQGQNMIIQPYLTGAVMSLSLLVLDGECRLLACNKQYIEIKAGAVHVVAIGVNECLDYYDKMLVLAQKVINTISGLAGYIGIDVVAYDNELYVLDINPRLTTAYVGLSASLGCNIAAVILHTFLTQRLAAINLDNAQPVKVVCRPQ